MAGKLVVFRNFKRNYLLKIGHSTGKIFKFENAFFELAIWIYMDVKPLKIYMYTCLGASERKILFPVLASNSTQSLGLESFISFLKLILKI